MKKYLFGITFLAIMWFVIFNFYKPHSCKFEPEILHKIKKTLFTYKNLGKLGCYSTNASDQKTPTNSLKASKSLCKQRLIDTIIIQKSKRTMKLYQGLELIKEYKVSLGFEPKGHKEEEGDGKTPEGEYKIIHKNPHSKFHKSLQISYPSICDTKAAQKRGVSPGNHIMIHGLKKEYSKLGKLHLLKNWTHGCIAVTNSEIDEIWNITPIGTKIFIIP